MMHINMIQAPSFRWSLNFIITYKITAMSYYNLPYIVVYQILIQISIKIFTGKIANKFA